MSDLHPLTEAFRQRLDNEGLIESVAALGARGRAVHARRLRDKRSLEDADNLADEFRILLIENRKWLADVLRGIRAKPASQSARSGNLKKSRAAVHTARLHCPVKQRRRGEPHDQRNVTPRAPRQGCFGR